MKKERRIPVRALLSLSALALVTIAATVPALFESEAAARRDVEKGQRAGSLPNYDIRMDKASFEKRAELRERVGRTPAMAADAREGFARGEARLKQRVPNLKVEHGPALGQPEVIGAAPGRRLEALTGPAAGRRADVLRSFIRDNEELFGGRADETLVVAADYENPEGELSFVEMTQEIDGVPVFGGEVKAGFTKRGEIVRVVNNVAPGLEPHGVVRNFGDAAAAVRAAREHIGREGAEADEELNAAESTETKAVFGSGDWATTAEMMYFPIEPGTAVPAWRVLIWGRDASYYVVVDAQGGEMLWRKNIVEEQTQSATYNVYANPNAFIPVADSPNPISPGLLAGPIGTQGSRIGRTTVTRVGNESPYTFNNNGWMTDGTNTTDGNAVESGVDRENPFGVDPNGKPVPTTNRVFDFAFNPMNPAGVPDAGESPLPAGVQPGACDAAGTNRPLIEFQKATATQLFYIVNWYHDETYRLGFNEFSRNFQHDNFGRGGEGGDRISANAQVCAGTNGGSFGTGADGNRGMLNMFIWTGPNPDIDGALDADVVIHELTHGLSNRLHGNATGLGTNMARGMGEGWSDFYAHAMLSEPSDPSGGVYPIGAYSTYFASGFYTGNSYYGIRRFPKAVMSATGGPQNRPHNPLTFADIDQSQMNISDGAFPAGPFGSGGSADQVHNAGEVWSSALWEVRARYIQRLGWEDGNRRVLQHVTDGMKLSPLAPTFLQARDAIIAAALGGGTPADAADAWAGFAIRGMGASASIQNPGSGSGNTRVTESFDTPNLRQTPEITVSDAGGNGSGGPDPGETVVLSVPLTNNTGTVATGVTLDLVGGGSADYGTIGVGATVVRDVTYVVDPGAVCGSLVSLTMNVDSNLGPASFEYQMAIGTPVVSIDEDFDDVTAPSIPGNWGTSTTHAPMTWVTTTTGPDTAPNSAFALDPDTVGGGTELYSPIFPVNAQAALVTFRHKYLTEAGWDGGVLEVNINGTGWSDVIQAGGSFISNGYNSTLGVSTPNPLGGRQGWSGDSGGYVTTAVRLPGPVGGANLQLRWRMGADNNTAPVNGGWNVDTIKIYGSYSCIIVDNFATPPFDFDGDGKTDVSIFRPAGGEWWYGTSSNGGHGAAVFGTGSDVIAPADYTGDGKTDMAFFRPSTGEWFFLRSEDFSFYSFPFGGNGDIPAPADYDGDGKADAAVYRPSTGTWYVFRSSDGQVSITGFGVAGDQPIPADYDGDGLADIGIFRPNGTNGAEWWVLRSTEGLLAVQFGGSDAKAVPGDYTGDGKADVAFFGTGGEWYILRSEDLSFYSFPFGVGSDIPVPGDYDGDGRIDAAVFRDSAATWYMQGSTSGTMITSFGVPGDRPVPNAFVR